MVFEQDARENVCIHIVFAVATYFLPTGYREVLTYVRQLVHPMLGLQFRAGKRKWHKPKLCEPNKHEKADSTLILKMLDKTKMSNVLRD